MESSLNKTGQDDDIEQLVVKAKNGDREALHDLISHTHTRLYRFCLYLSGNASSAEDLCQESFVKVLKDIQKIKEPHRFWSWLFSTTKNLYIDLLRRTKLRDTASFEEIPEEALEDKEKTNPQIIAGIQSALSTLSPEDRFLLLLVDQQGYSYKEAAQMLQISEAALTSRLRRIREAFISKYR